MATEKKKIIDFVKLKRTEKIIGERKYKIEVKF